ncbi:MAG: aspartate carbamoyltransferase regulatory subunit [Paludibacteraceae bacterium]|jgi:aspartate carbamoyltransferase regulatory subunit|nr:aspartate carbamoyltransferase regulatory subunit [Paludibacteraceae bacterium]
MEDSKKEMLVAAIENGTVIDHIASEKLFEVVSILNLAHSSSEITIGNNLKSEKQGAKGIIKIADTYFAPDEINRIALVAPNAVLNIIKDYKVVEKRKIEIPDHVIDIIRCFNPKCITNHEPMQTRFDVIDKQKMIVKCHYCESVMEQNQIKIK